MNNKRRVKTVIKVLAVVAKAAIIITSIYAVANRIQDIQSFSFFFTTF